MSRPVLTFAVVAVAAVQLSGCASIVKGSSATVAVTTPPVQGAACVLSAPEGSWQVTSPGSVTVQRSKHDIQVRCTKEGYQDAAAVIPSSFEGWSLGNLILGGVVGVVVDASTGAMNDYPNAFQVPMTKLDVADTAAPVMVPVSDVKPAADPKAPKSGN